MLFSRPFESRNFTRFRWHRVFENLTKTIITSFIDRFLSIFIVGGNDQKIFMNIHRTIAQKQRTLWEIEIEMHFVDSRDRSDYPVNKPGHPEVKTGEVNWNREPIADRSCAGLISQSICGVLPVAVWCFGRKRPLGKLAIESESKIESEHNLHNLMVRQSDKEPRIRLWEVTWRDVTWRRRLRDVCCVVCCVGGIKHGDTTFSPRIDRASDRCSDRAPRFARVDAEMIIVSSHHKQSRHDEIDRIFRVFFFIC